MFSAPALCLERGYARDCFVEDDHHAVSTGTSMSAPLVSGAIALFFERDPSLDQGRVLALLQAGSRELSGVVFDERQVGPGELDLEGALDAFAPSSEGEPGGATRLTLGASFAHPDSSWPLEGFALVRDDADHVADAFDSGRLTLEVRGAEIVRPLARVTAGMFSFAVAAEPGTGGRTLTLALRFDGRKLAERTVPIAVDPALAGTRPSASGGCAFVRNRRSAAWDVALVLGALAFARRRFPASKVRARCAEGAR
jgi:hypothetical protein